jgi:hypothetical protein
MMMLVVSNMFCAIYIYIYVYYNDSIWFTVTSSFFSYSTLCSSSLITQHVQMCTSTDHDNHHDHQWYIMIIIIYHYTSWSS